MRIPRKKELLELQKKYRTDKKIGEVYGVPSRLVAYWRNKKKINSYSFPKYSEDRIRELWDRFGDDAKAGEELNISKAGFRQWRRKYAIDHKPIQLRLEQLELPLPDLNRRKNSRRETIVQKIMAKKSGLKKVEIGEIVDIEPDMVIVDDNAARVLSYFNQTGADKVWQPDRIVIILDRQIADISGNGIISHRAIREFVKRQKIKNFYDVGHGICHQIALENAFILPGQLTLALGSHSLIYGSLGSFATSVTADEMAAIWVSGRIWMRVPDTIKVYLDGRLSRGVFARDIILKLAHDLAFGGASYKSLEFYGPIIDTMPISERFTLSAVSDTIGCKSAIIPYDEITGRYLRKISKNKAISVAADSDAAYLNEVRLDVTYLAPQIGLPLSSDGIQPVEEAVGKRVEQVVLGGCVSGRIEDFEIAARILRGRHINRDTRMFIVPASRNIMLEAVEKGLVRTFIDSGCIVASPGCGSCLDTHHRFLEPGERVATTSDCHCHNSGTILDTEFYVVSPATAAATALEGSIADPRKYLK